MRAFATIVGVAFLQFASLAVTISNVQGSPSSPTELKVNRLEDPLAVDSKEPLFSWVVNSNKRGDFQVAYRIIVSSTKKKAETEDGDVWNSGKVISGNQSDIVYNGSPLKSEKDYFWKVCIWNSDRVRTGWSATARFGTGILSWHDWKGAFIGGREFQLYRKEFTRETDKSIATAKLYIGALGVPVVYINGQKVGNSVLNSAESVIRETTWYRGYDVTDMLTRGTNVVGVMMGQGLLGRAYGSPDMMKFITNLIIAYSDGSTEVIASDTTWKATKDGPLVATEMNNVADGEKYDARKLPKGWNEPLFNDKNWESGNALTVAYKMETLKAQLTPPMEVIETVRPQYVSEVSPGTYVVDAHRNITGWAQVAIGGAPGDKLEMRFAEDVSSLWNDYSFVVTSNVVRGTAGILIRAVDENNFYYWKVTTAGKISAYKKVNGDLRLIKEIPCKISLNTRYNMKIKAVGSEIDTYCNDTLIDMVIDSTFLSGKVGFRETDDDTARFCGIKVIYEHSHKILLESSGKNPWLWLNNQHIKSILRDSATGYKLEVAKSDYVVSTFGNVNGGIDQTSLSIASFVPNLVGTGAMQYDYYIHSGSGVETWEPFQTIHGFRYIEVKGCKDFDFDNIKIRIVHEAVDKEKDSVFFTPNCQAPDEGKGNIGSLSTSNQLLKDLYKASLSSIKSALQWGVLASCVSRDERGGWTGDAECTSQAANYYADLEPVYKQWFVDMRETQHSDGYIDNLAPRQGERAGALEEDIPWSSAVINVTWDTYWASGDKSIIRDQYDAMKKFIDWCVNTSNLSASAKSEEDYTTDKDCWGDYGSVLEMSTCCPVPLPEKSLYATAFFIIQQCDWQR